MKNKLRAQILSEFKTPLPLVRADAITALFQYDNGEVLEKRTIDIVDVQRGIIEIELTDFEIQGLPLGHEQNFKCEIFMDGYIWTVLFAKGLNVGVDEKGRKLLI